MGSVKAVINVFGPKGVASADVEVRDDGIIEPAFAEQALAHALNVYNGIEKPEDALDP